MKNPRTTPGQTLADPTIPAAWWGASTAFWVDPVDDVVALFLTQLVPSSTYPIRSQLQTLVQQAVVDR